MLQIGQDLRKLHTIAFLELNGDWTAASHYRHFIFAESETDLAFYI